MVDFPYGVSEHSCRAGCDCRNPICDLCAACLPDHPVDPLALGGRTLEIAQGRAHDSVLAVRSRLDDSPLLEAIAVAAATRTTDDGEMFQITRSNQAARLGPPFFSDREVTMVRTLKICIVDPDPTKTQAFLSAHLSGGLWSLLARKYYPIGFLGVRIFRKPRNSRHFCAH